VLRDCVRQVAEYFAGTRRRFELALGAEGTPFQRRVWDQIARIPYGKTITYADLAARSGAPGSARAAGAATGRNPLAIVVPCHRVVGARGELTGYAGGVPRKARLLALEGAREELFA
jgi:methylated-DNA-[protein]-cysteine S-methyltransferase